VHGDSQACKQTKAARRQLGAGMSTLHSAHQGGFLSSISRHQQWLFALSCTDGHYAVQGLYEALQLLMTIPIKCVEKAVEYNKQRPSQQYVHKRKARMFLA
jgi:hypothetical protein